MDRLAATADRLETLAMGGADADLLSAELAAVARVWREETEAEIGRLGAALAASSIRHQADRDRALWSGMAAESRRQARIALALARAAHGAGRGGEVP